MIQKLIAWFKPPLFAEDEEKSRIAGILNGVLLVSAGACVFVLLFMPLAPDPLVGTLILGGMILTLLAALAALRRGLVYPLVHLLAFSLWLATSVFTALSGGLLSPETAGYVLVVLIAVLLAGARYAWVYTLLSLFAVTVIYFLQQNHWLDQPVLELSPIVGLVIALANILLTAAVSTLALGSLAESMRRAYFSRQESTTKGQALQELLATLEERVQERTASAETARAEGEAARQAMQEQIWLTSGQAQIGQALQGEQTLVEIGRSALGVLCPYLQAQAGALYALDNERLLLSGGYAQPVDLPDSLALGEGLVGQVALDHRLRRIQSAQSGLRIGSGLGSVEAEDVLIYPLLDGGRLMGVVELAWLEQAPAAAETLLARVSGSLAVALRTALAHRRAKELTQGRQS